MFKIKSISSFILVISLTAIYSNTASAESNTLPTSCEQGSAANGEIVNVTGEGHQLYKTPQKNADLIINEKATEILKETQYHSIDYSTKVQVLCQKDDFIKIKIVEPDWLTHVIGWTEKKNLELPNNKPKKDKNLSVVEAPYYHPYQYVAMSVSQASKITGGTPNKVDNIIIDSEDTHMLLEANDDSISFVSVDLNQTAPCSLTKEFDSKPILEALGINPADLEFARKKTHYHTYYDHKNKLKVSVSCPFDRGPLSVGFSKKYYEGNSSSNKKIKESVKDDKNKNQEKLSINEGEISCNNLQYGSDNYTENMENLATTAKLADNYYNKYHEDLVKSLCNKKTNDVDNLVNDGYVTNKEAITIAKILDVNYQGKKRSEDGESYGYSKEKFLSMGLCSSCSDNIAQFYTKKPSSSCGKLAKKALEGNPSAIKELQEFPDFCIWKY